MVKLKRISEELDSITESMDEKDQQKSPRDYLMSLIKMLFSSRKVNPKGNSPEGNYKFYNSGQYTGVNILNRSIGDWELSRVTDDGYNIITDASIDGKDYGDMDVAPIPGKPGKYRHPNTPTNSVYYVEDYYTLLNEDEIKKIIEEFCKINKCLVDYNLYSSGTGSDDVLIQLTLKKSPDFNPVERRRQWGDSDSDWETLDDQERRHKSL